MGRKLTGSRHVATVCLLPTSLICADALAVNVSWIWQDLICKQCGHKLSWLARFAINVTGSLALCPTSLWGAQAAVTLDVIAAQPLVIRTS